MSSSLTSPSFSIQLDLKRPLPGPADGEQSPAAEIPAPLLKVSILGCPARDEANELALLMLRQLFISTRYDVEVMSDAVLTSEVVGMIGAKNPAVIVIATLSPGGMAQTRYLCKRLRARVPNLKIAIGQWGMESEERSSVALAEADKVGTTMIETRDQIIQLSQSNPHPSIRSLRRLLLSLRTTKCFPLRSSPNQNSAAKSFRNSTRSYAG